MEEDNTVELVCNDGYITTVPKNCFLTKFPNTLIGAILRSDHESSSITLNVNQNELNFVLPYFIDGKDLDISQLKWADAERVLNYFNIPIQHSITTKLNVALAAME